MIITIGRKPLECAAVYQNISKHSTGGVFIDGCRIGFDSIKINTWDGGAKPFGGCQSDSYSSRQVEGRFPSNFLLSESCINLLPETQGSGHWANTKVTGYGEGIGSGSVEYFGVGEKDDTGGTVAKFFFIIKE